MLPLDETNAPKILEFPLYDIRNILKEPEILDENRDIVDLERAIFVDDRQKDGYHDLKHDYLKSRGYQLINQRLVTADYATDNQRHIIDTKKLPEISVCFGKEFGRTQNEVLRAKSRQYSIFYVVETDEFENIDEFIAAWKNPECYGDDKRVACPYYSSKMCDPECSNTPCYKWEHTNGHHPISAERIAANIRKLEISSSFYLMFCKPEDTGKVIEELLFGVKADGVSHLNIIH